MQFRMQAQQAAEQAVAQRGQDEEQMQEEADLEHEDKLTQEELGRPVLAERNEVSVEEQDARDREFLVMPATDPKGPDVGESEASEPSMASPAQQGPSSSTKTRKKVTVEKPAEARDNAALGEVVQTGERMIRLTEYSERAANLTEDQRKHHCVPEPIRQLKLPFMNVVVQECTTPFAHSWHWEVYIQAAFGQMSSTWRESRSGPRLHLIQDQCIRRYYNRLADSDLRSDFFSLLTASIHKFAVENGAVYKLSAAELKSTPIEYEYFDAMEQSLDPHGSVFTILSAEIGRAHV